MSVYHLNKDDGQRDERMEESRAKTRPKVTTLYMYVQCIFHSIMVSMYIPDMHALYNTCMNHSMWCKHSLY